ncbi:MAG: phosphoribosylglycinamide formyltransferase, partial [Luteimonas sp.]
ATADGVLNARISGVSSDRARAGVWRRARDADIPACALDPKTFDSRDAFDAALFAEIAKAAPDLIVCAGYLRLLTPDVVEAWRGRMLNIHPSLLPAFKGLRTHQRALEAGVAEHGASVHFVTPDVDGGPVLAQARVPVLPRDDASTLAARVLGREHPLLVRSLRLLASGRATLHGDCVRLDGMPLRTPLQLTANNALA